jgi:hypothetical protein
MPQWGIYSEKAFRLKIENKVDLLKKICHVSSPSQFSSQFTLMTVRIMSSHTFAAKVGKWDDMLKSSCLFIKAALSLKEKISDFKSQEEPEESCDFNVSTQS